MILLYLVCVFLEVSSLVIANIGLLGSGKTKMMKQLFSTTIYHLAMVNYSMELQL